MQTLLRRCYRTTHKLLAFFILLTTSSLIRAGELPVEGTVLPASPIAFEPAYLVLPLLSVDGYCHGYRYMPEFNAVEMVSGRLSVHARTTPVIAPHPLPGACGRNAVYLGRLPKGDYPVELVIEGSLPSSHQYALTVLDTGVGDEKAPAHDYSGFFWDPLESGSSLQVIQTGQENLAAVLLTYDDDGRQQWIVIGAGGWETPGRYVGKAWRTQNGHPIGSPPPIEPTQAEGELIGNVTIDFGDGISPDSASVFVIANGELLYQRHYRRFEF